MDLEGVLPRDVIAQRSGLEQLRAIIAGEMPQPTMARTLAFALVDVSEGRAVFRAMPNAGFMNPLGTIHGGWASAVLDSALGCAVHSTLAPGDMFTTLELKVNLTRAIRPDTGALIATGTILTRGRRTATSEARLCDETGRIFAHATSTCLVIGSSEGTGT